MMNYSQWPIIGRVLPDWPIRLDRAWTPVTSDTPMATRVLRDNYGPHWLITITPPVIPQSEER